VEGQRRRGRGADVEGVEGEPYKKTEHDGTNEHNRSSDRSSLSYAPYSVPPKLLQNEWT